MAGRYAVAALAGLVVTAAILVTMQGLIATANLKLDESGVRHFVDFVHVDREETLVRKERHQERPPDPEPPPPAAPQPRIADVDPRHADISIGTIPMTSEPTVGGLGLAVGDGEYLPIVKIAPLYPWRAQSEGIEGRVVVEFTVTETGSVKDVVVIEADPKNVFDKVSIQAALKFKYRPKVVDGEPIEVRGVRNVFLFQLEE
ncbi:MAG: protein TonB [Gemmatimonadota bacterium]|nr:MAG: protein TonB [Gemmatimonadota bacterium]